MLVYPRSTSGYTLENSREDDTGSRTSIRGTKRHADTVYDIEWISSRLPLEIYACDSKADGVGRYVEDRVNLGIRDGWDGMLEMLWPCKAWRNRTASWVQFW